MPAHRGFRIAPKIAGTWREVRDLGETGQTTG